MSQRLASLPIDRAEDVFALRQCGRVAASALGCEESEQVRVATALSELGREAVLHGGGSSVVFSLETDGALLIEFQRFPQASLRSDATFSGLAAAQRLIDTLSIVESGGSPAIVFRVQCGVLRRGAKISPRQLGEAIRRTAAPRPLDELRLENRDLVQTLAELKTQKEELVQLNAELQETNRGVMAMYTQLAGELDETNRGVVALYAELDDKSVRVHEADQAKTRFLASVSHELRSPINSIIGLTRLLMDQDANSSSNEQQKQLKLIAGSAAELLRLVNDLLDLAKAESGRLVADVGEVDLSEVFLEMRGSLRPFVRPEVSLVFDMEDIPAIQTDRLLLTQIIRNLATNALKFTPEGTVSVCARRAEHETVQIEVADTGIGIAAEDQPKVFEEFFQVRGPLQAQHKGSGLGLPYARRVAQALGGDIALRSESGRGSTFTVWLPIRRGEPAFAGPAPQHGAGAAAAPVGRVLIIDDDAAFRSSLCGMLQGMALQVLEASGGAEGLAEMRRARPDVAFLDLRMPDLSGADVLAQMDADASLRDIKVVIVTGTELAAPDPALRRVSALLSKADINAETVSRALGQAVHT
ncbi:MAG TPA: ATP-binding protein [Candidatus Baltobacteraceae bacterium]|nr:ATP-binding protein [Candidatus Baltobacteraceae bacterium]